MTKKKIKKRHKSRTNIRVILRVVKLSGICVCLFFTVGFGFPKGIQTAIPYFTVKKILITGNRYITPEMVREKAGIYYGQNIFIADMDKIEQSVRSLPNVENVIVRRILPDIIGIRLIEQSPIAIKDGENPVLVNNCGDRLEFDLSVENVDLPVLTGFHPGDDEETSAERMEQAQNILQIVEMQGFPLKISEINLSNLENIVLYPVNLPVSIHLAGEKWAEQLEKFSFAWDQIKAQIKPGDRLDLRFRRQIVRKPAKTIITARN